MALLLLQEGSEGLVGFVKPKMTLSEEKKNQKNLSLPPNVDVAHPAALQSTGELGLPGPGWLQGGGTGQDWSLE